MSEDTPAALRTLTEEDGEYHAMYDDSVCSPSEAVVEVVSAATDIDPVELTPLFETIDTEVLDTLLASRVAVRPVRSAGQRGVAGFR